MTAWQVWQNIGMTRWYTTRWHTGDQCFIELMHALTNPEEHWAQPERPDLLLALDELIAWMGDFRDYDERVHESGWTSAVNDFFAATDSLGTKTKKQIQCHIDSIRGSWQSGLGGDRPLREQVRDEAIAMRHALSTKSALQAAWADLVGILGRAETSMAAVSVRRDNFWMIVRAGDRNRSELSRRLTSVLTGDPFQHLVTRLELGEITEIDPDVRPTQTGPFISPRQRLDLAVKILVAEPEVGTHKVWFAFRHANISFIGKIIGRIQFFEARWLRENLLQGGPFKEDIPDELWDLDHPETIPDSANAVLASIDLGTAAFSDAVRTATEQMDAFLQISTVGYAYSWQRLPGFIHVLNGKIAGHQYFIPEDDEFGQAGPMMGLGDKIASIAPLVEPKIPVIDPEIKDIVDALHWWRGGDDRPNAASIILDVRIIELIASRIREEHWTAYLEKYMKNSWIQGCMLDEMRMILRQALAFQVSPHAEERQREIFLEVSKPTDGLGVFRINTAMNYIDEIIEFISPKLPLGRDLRTLRQKTSTNAALGAWCTELDRLWGSQIHRLERVRNAIAHGGPFTDQVVTVTRPFSQRLSAWALNESVDGFLQGKGLAQSHFDRKHRWDAWRSSLRHATSAADVFIK